MVEGPIEFAEILKVLGWSDSKFWKYRKDLLACGAIYYDKAGRAPRVKIRAFKSRLERYLILKSRERFKDRM